VRPDLVIQRRRNLVIVCNPELASATFRSAAERGAITRVRVERRKSDRARRAWSRCGGCACRCRCAMPASRCVSTSVNAGRPTGADTSRRSWVRSNAYWDLPRQADHGTRVVDETHPFVFGGESG
jgi:hypothetical protein